MKKILSSSILLTAVLGTMIVSVSNVMADTANSNNNKQQEQNTSTTLSVSNENQSTNSLLENTDNVQKTNAKGDLTLDYVPTNFLFKNSYPTSGDFIYQNTLVNNDNKPQYVQVSDYRPNNIKNWTLSATIDPAKNNKDNNVSLKIKDLKFQLPFMIKKSGLDEKKAQDANESEKIINANGHLNPIMSSNELKDNSNNVSTILKGFKKITMESERKSGDYTGQITWNLSGELGKQ